MGTIAARHAKQIVSNSTRVIATEILAACQAIDFRKEMNPDLKLGKGTQKAYDLVRESIPFIDDDKNFELFNVLEDITELVVYGDFLEEVESVTKLN